ncbi:MAG: glycoside hydrolase family 5 protein [Ignavibacteriae bacterium]|nr:glycoside hydrolase family 5 protein [Ignavibacteriota bacterium]MCB0750052.1 glycoside hydrolase family 5 protein [Ignavibacteriota bacterium]MCB9208303.1 glycoside hydrolase family 5 protein [Ignavibacteriales bacterium]MCB9259065.1 glycoside hydrolase family 5 protein [Ignavibacteriales bacterium]
MSHIFEFNRKIGKGINFGNALEAPVEGVWGLKIKNEYFNLIKQAGFTSVRIPIRWSIHSSNKEPYKINDDFFLRIDEVINQALENNLIVIINIHHFYKLFFNPNKFETKFYSLWDQLSNRYAKYSENLIFELLNEPHYFLTTTKWNRFVQNVLPIIRRSNPTRAILIGPGRWNNIEGLNNLILPENKENIIVTFHYYKPFTFTHQGAEWVYFSHLFLKNKWKGSPKERKKIVDHFLFVSSWSLKNNVPINLGEFGSYYHADLESRKRWTKTVIDTAEKFGFSWNYWEFGAGFGVYDITKNKWKEELLSSLIN